MFSKHKQKSGAQKWKKKQKQDEGTTKMAKLDTIFTQTQATTQAKASVPPEASGSLPASSIEAAAALTPPPRPASPVGPKETSPAPKLQGSESADSAVPTRTCCRDYSAHRSRTLHYSAS